MYGTEIDLSWADRRLVRSRSVNLRFISHLCIFGPRYDGYWSTSHTQTHVVTAPCQCVTWWVTACIQMTNNVQ